MKRIRNMSSITVGTSNNMSIFTVIKRKIGSVLHSFVYRAKQMVHAGKYCSIKYGFSKMPCAKINLCSGTLHLDGYCNIDVDEGSDLILDLNKKLLPFADSSAEVVVCMSAINYFTHMRGAEIIADVYRVLKPGGISRFGTQDLKLIAEKYVANDKEFFFQKLSDGTDRFVGDTMADKINSWFYGYPSGKGAVCKYFYDYEALAALFVKAGFSVVERKAYGESRIPEVMKIDNRPEQMFFLEAIK